MNCDRSGATPVTNPALLGIWEQIQNEDEQRTKEEKTETDILKPIFMEYILAIQISEDRTCVSLAFATLIGAMRSLIAPPLRNRVASVVTSDRAYQAMVATLDNTQCKENRDGEQEEG